jgi:suppressor for copper-sensitivity B
VLMATVLWLMSSIKTTILIPLLVVLLGIATTLWLIGMVQFSHSAMKRRIVSIAALALGLGIGTFGYLLTVDPTHQLAWQPFTTERVNALRAEGKPILIDFTADWCANCKVNEKFALNTAATKELVERHGVVPLLADFTDESDEIKGWLDRFGALGVPLTVIFPAGRPDDPIILDGVYTQRTLLKRLEEATRPPTLASTAVTTAEAR